MDKITLERIELLHPKLREEVRAIYKEICEALTGNAMCRFSHTLRTFAEQDALYAQGRTKPGAKVTNAKGGQSYHNYGLACFDEKTEILTEKGFVKFKDLLQGEKVATYKNGICRFDVPKAYVSYPYKGKMIHFKTRSIDQLVTPNHKMIVQKKKGNEWGEWEEIRADHVNYQYRIPTTALSFNNSIVKYNQLNTIKGKVYNSIVDTVEGISYPFSNQMSPETWWEFMGWFLSEGYTAGSDSGLLKKHSGRFKVAICQSKDSSVYNKLKDCLDRTGFSYTESYREFVIHSSELWSVLSPLKNSYAKYIERYLLEADVDLLKILYTSLIDGDGCYYEKHETYYTASKKLCDGFCELVLRLGMSCIVKERTSEAGSMMMPHGELLKSNTFCYEVIVRRGKTQELRNGAGEKKINKVDYDGMVYCVETNDGAVVIRRNGNISISGNCDIVLIVDKDGNGSYESASWDVKSDFDGDGKSDWQEVVQIFKRYGWEWGGDWKFYDAPHFQKTFGYSINDLLTAFNSKKFIPNTNYVSI